MLTVVTFKWNNPDYQGEFKSEHVNVLRNMVKRHYDKPHRFVCFTDDPEGIDSDIETFPVWDDYADVPNPTGGGRPTCYRRLKLFDPAIREYLGDRFVNLDLDCVILDDLSPLFDRDEEIVLWRQPTQEWPYNGAMVMMTAGARPQVWEDFDPVRSPKETNARGYRGSDQAWISHKLGAGEAVWTQRDGVYFHQELRGIPPKNARIVFFIGKQPPWRRGETWVRQAYR